MRRSEFEVTDAKEIRSFLEKCQVFHLGLCMDNQPYVVPLSYGMVFDGCDRLTKLYFHCALEGKKLSYLQDNPYICFEMDGDSQIIPSDQACGYTMKYASVIGYGCACMVLDRDEKQIALNTLMEHYAPMQQWSFPDAALDHTCIFSITVDHLTFKKRL